VGTYLKLLCFLILSLILGASQVFATSTDQAALVIIDMQPNFVTRGGFDRDPENKKKVEQILRAQITAIRTAEKAKLPIIVIEYEGEGKTSAVLQEEMKDYPNRVNFLKNTDGMFDAHNKHLTEITEYLEKNGIHELIITGANGGACVKMSIQGALNKNYRVVAYTKGIADFNYKNFIYPYVNQYQDVKAGCAHCSFEEVSNLTKTISIPFDENSIPECLRPVYIDTCAACDILEKWIKTQ
jgi:nicotinamidase-related amidase